MKIKKCVSPFLCIALLASGLSGCANETANSSAAADYSTQLFGEDIIKIELSTAEADWNSLLEHATEKPSIRADVTINGVTFSDVGVKTKGNTSLTQVAETDSTRYSLLLNFDQYVDGQSCYGLDKLVLNNIYADTTYLKEYMSYEVFQYMEVPSSLSTFAEVTVNGEHYGFYLALEQMDDEFLTRNFGTADTGEAYKPESLQMGGKKGDGPHPDGEKPVQPDGEPPTMENGQKPQMPDGGKGMDGGSAGVNLVYTDDKVSSYSGIFDNAITKADETDQKRLIASLKAIQAGEDIETYINVDEVLRYAAVNVFLVNLDSYFSNMGHNYCLYEKDGTLSMLPWDYNLSFGTYSSQTSSDAVNYPIDTVFSGVSAEERPIMGVLFQNEEYVKQYHAYLAQLTQYVTSGAFNETVDRITAEIDDYVQRDSTSFAGYDAFVSGVSALKSFAALRAQSVNGQLDGSIPSTLEGQSGSDQLIDSSALELKTLGGMNRGDGEPAQGGAPAGDDAALPPSKTEESATENRAA